MKICIQAVSLFDQSSNHCAYALVALRLIVNDKDLARNKKPTMKDGYSWMVTRRLSNLSISQRWSRKEGKRLVQLRKVNAWTSLGIQSILDERNLGWWDKYKKENEH